ncbi:hypothetical protein B0H15DRAFT_540310 [Mycena belliarum]|uniref:MYND-type domain-containing protein n=1 Tax=Mycena belliarum TaxID=1033014 RepID=A0AAD6TUP4_9AGAR|nr:hypothetical protein B0H15DRAFT_540310 [Mycena belliae]
MSRNASMKFKPASAGDTYDKMSECTHCYKEPECQAKEWPVHKTVCGMRKRTVAAMANAPSSPSFPPFFIRKRLLTDFIEVHECSFDSAFTSAIIIEGGIDNFAYERRAILVLLKYRPDCQENPSVAYSVEGCQWTADNSPFSALEAKIDREMRAQDAGYRGLLRVYFRIEDHVIGEAYPQTHMLGPTGAVHRTYVQSLDHTDWVSRVQKRVRDGLVVRQPDEKILMMQLGKMVMKKGKWVWVQLTAAQLVEYGYPSNFPGLLF